MPKKLRNSVMKTYKKMVMTDDKSYMVHFLSVENKRTMINVLKLSPYSKGLQNQLLLHYRQKKGMVGQVS